jgi:hypothetical protein
VRFSDVNEAYCYHFKEKQRADWSLLLFLFCIQANIKHIHLNLFTDAENQNDWNNRLSINGPIFCVTVIYLAYINICDGTSFTRYVISHVFEYMIHVFVSLTIVTILKNNVIKCTRMCLDILF